MTIDIEKLINDIDEDGSGEIEYDEFRNLLSSSDWVRAPPLSRTAAPLSTKALMNELIIFKYAC